MNWVNDILKIVISTLGCKVNQYESEELRQAFSAAGCEVSNSTKGKVDVYIINTCTVTAVSDRKSRQMIRRAIRENPQATIVATGCYAEAALETISKIAGVDMVVGNRKKLKIPQLILGSQLNASKLMPVQQDRTRALVKIQDGCDQFCAFCQIPYVRGNLSSRDSNEVVYEVKRLVENSVKEIVLTGINLGKYGNDLDGRFDLVDLISQLILISGLERLRLSSIEVKEVSERLISLFASSSKLCNHLHIPLQSGDDEILKKMNRNYSSEEYLSIVRSIKRKVQNLALTTDIMVGFPGESEDKFRRTLHLAKEIGFAKIHVFNFSPRPGTIATEMTEQISSEVKKNRVEMMIETARELSKAHRRRFIDQAVNVLVEKEKNGFLTGLTDNYIRVRFEGPSELIGEIVPVELCELKEEYILGRLLDSTIQDA